MGNICYTTYKIEGPEKEILSLRQYLQEMMALKSKEQKEDALEREKELQSQPSKSWSEMTRAEQQREEYRLERQSAGRERRFDRKMDKYGAGYWLTGCYTIQSPLDDNCLEKLNNGWLLLSVEASSKWGPDFSLWDWMLKHYAPHARYYYYTEEFWAGAIQTNDVWRKYFRADYALCAYLPAGTPKDVYRLFASDEAEHRMREDQYNMYFTYWTQSRLRNELIWYLGNGRRLHMAELLERFDRHINRKVKVKYLTLFIRPIERVESKGQERPCTHCDRLEQLQNENYRYCERMERLERIVKGLMATRHQHR